MLTECGSPHPKIPGVDCTLEKHPGNDHSYKGDLGEINWKSEQKQDVVHTKAQMLQMIGDHKTKLQQTIDELKNSSGLGKDLIDTLVPPMQTQLFFIEQLVQGMKE